jgi:5'-methylthioadenosine phosphorylase
VTESLLNGAETKASVGIIGGSGLYEVEGIADLEEVRLSTPFGEPSDVYVVGTWQGQRVAFLPRHGRGHRVSPTELNSRANVFGFKLLGVERLISVSAVGSMREEIHPLDIVIPDQLLDRTRLRENTFFGNGVVVHTGFADPFCADLCGILASAAEGAGARVHRGGTYVCIEGPQFSTRAESRIFRQWGVDVIGMTALPEARLAREAEMCYGTIALATDYDVWHDEPVTVEMVIGNLTKNVATAKAILAAAIPAIGPRTACACGSALENAIMTRRDLIPEQARRDLAPLLGRYLA